MRTEHELITETTNPLIQKQNYILSSYLPWNKQ